MVGVLARCGLGPILLERQQRRLASVIGEAEAFGRKDGSGALDLGPGHPEVGVAANALRGLGLEIIGKGRALEQERANAFLLQPREQGSKQPPVTELLHRPGSRLGGDGGHEGGGPSLLPRQQAGDAVPVHPGQRPPALLLGQVRILRGTAAQGLGKGGIEPLVTDHGWR